MNSDLMLVTGVVLAVFAIPAVVSAFSERRPPRIAAGVLIVAVCLVLWAVLSHPGGYSPGDVPAAFVRVLGGILH